MQSLVRTSRKQERDLLSAYSGEDTWPTEPPTNDGGQRFASGGPETSGPSSLIAINNDLSQERGRHDIEPNQGPNDSPRSGVTVTAVTEPDVTVAIRILTETIALQSEGLENLSSRIDTLADQLNQFDKQWYTSFEAALEGWRHSNIAEHRSTREILSQERAQVLVLIAEMKNALEGKISTKSDPMAH
ncbi:MAG: AAA ATPase [Chaenotheca gracillima]|nr:MAG: AAA ATPase [Chaenotheca gracillima]